MTKFITPAEAAAMIPDGARIGVSGFATAGSADAVLRQMAERFHSTGSPRSLSVLCPTCAIVVGGQENQYGLTALREEGMVSALYTSRLGTGHMLADLANQNKIAAYILPLGIFGHLFRAQAGRKPGILTHIGLYTFADPRNEGCRMNQQAMDRGEELVTLINLDGKDYLFYRAIPLDICLIRGSYADEDGNVSIEREVIPAESVEMAEAVHNSGGIVIVQVSKVVQGGSIHPKRVALHRKLVDYVVVADSEDHPFSYTDREFRPELVGDLKVPVKSVAPMDMGLRKVIARRGAMELQKDWVVNLGFGISDGVAIVANEEGLADRLTLSIETGIFGGVPLPGDRMGQGVNQEATYRMADIFDLYDGGILDATFLSFAEVDREGNVNVSKFGGRIIGPGGFINIAQNTKKLHFLAAFTAGKMTCTMEGGQLRILQDGTRMKFKEKVESITFSGKYALESGQDVMYITERAVFRLTPGGLMLTEIAPGVDLQRDILAHMEFEPLISPHLKEMDGRIFRPEKMGLSFRGDTI